MFPIFGTFQRSKLSPSSQFESNLNPLLFFIFCSFTWRVSPKTCVSEPAVLAQKHAYYSPGPSCFSHQIPIKSLINSHITWPKSIALRPGPKCRIAQARPEKREKSERRMRCIRWCIIYIYTHIIDMYMYIHI